MTKKKTSRQTVRQSRRRRREEARKRRQSQQNQIIVIAAGVLILLVAGWFLRQALSGRESEVERSLASLEPSERNGYYDEYPAMVIDTSKEYEALLRTEKGNLRLRLFDDEAPLTVNNFVFLAGQGFYDNTTFHRVLPDFMAQAGDPLGTGTGGPGYEFEDETDNGLTFDRPGLLAMANRGPGTNGSQFFITFVPTPHLDGRHTIFGELIEGEDVLNSISFVEPNPDAPGQGDTIDRIDIIER